MIKINNIEEILENSEVLYNEPLRKYSFTKTGGNAEVLVKITNEQDLQNIIKYSNENNIELTILGNGSNVLISDNGIAGIVAITSDMNKIELLDGDVISCYAGLTLKELTDFCIENSLTNLEFSCGIPGSVGGAIFMNAGAYGGEMKEVVQKVEVFTKNGEKKIYTNEQMEFSYRHSLIQETKEIISRVYFQMKKGNKEEIITLWFNMWLQKKDLGIDITKFQYPEPQSVGKLRPKFSDVMEKDVPSVKYYLSTVYLDTLKRHRARHEAAGHGFGYEIIDTDGVANAIVVGGMGRERNLIIDPRLKDFTPITRIKGEVNREGIRRMTPREWARLQGFPDSFKIVVADASAYKQFGNSVAIPAIQMTAKNELELLGLI